MKLDNFKNLSALLPEMEVIDEMYETAACMDDVNKITKMEKELSAKMANAFYEDTKDFNSRENVNLIFTNTTPWIAIKRLENNF